MRIKQLRYELRTIECNLAKGVGGQRRFCGLYIERAALNAARLRCENPDNLSYAWYGARGIKFLIPSVKALVAAIGPRPEGKTRDRINNDGHYEIGNVRWATRLEQARNKRK